jgi:hypothetical protein
MFVVAIEPWPIQEGSISTGEAPTFDTRVPVTAPVPPEQGRNRQRVDLAAADLKTEIARLTSLGAARLAEVDEGVEFADPEGNELRIMEA